MSTKHVSTVTCSEELVLDDRHAQSIASTPLSIDLRKGAEAGTRAEHALPVKDALRKWPKAVMWSVIFSSTIIMEGYDTALLSAFWGYPSFQKQFGVKDLATHDTPARESVYQVPASWQSGTSSVVLITNIIGVFVSGSLVDRYGYKKVFLGSLALVVIFIFGTFFSTCMPTLFIAEALCGLPWGAFSTLGPAYASEIAPVALRGYLTTYVNLCWLLGQLISSGVLKSLLARTDEWGYRIPFALQWVWPLPIFIALIFAPESPWYFVRQNDHKRARRSLTQVCNKDLVNIDDHLAMLIQTNEFERTLGAGTRYIDCFRGVNRRRTEVSCMAWAIQTLSGNPFSGQAIYFFTVAGISTSTAYSMGVGIYALGACGTILSWFLMLHHGRRSIYLVGMCIMTLLMLAIGCASISRTTSATLTQATLMISWVFVYDLTVGPIAFSLVSELSSTRLRAKTIGLGRILYNLTGLSANLIQPFFLNPTALDFHGRIGFIWAALSLLCTVWVYFRSVIPQVLHENTVVVLRIVLTLL